jgi:topoisomerase IV subunit A
VAYVNTLFNTNFLEYASYVIKDRAIPHLDDGLKPVQRRILHSLLEMDDGKFHKVANVVGHCMKYHPHGDQSIYSALVVLANKDLFIEKQGNFGNMYTGDEASAARYIESRITQFAREILYNPELTEFIDSYDGRNSEPVTFPSKLPIILVQGTEGIAVGMATKILPHNLLEVVDAMKAQLRGESFILFPDFPTGGLVDVSDYEDGLGKVLVRARLDISDPKRIVVRELPFGTTTESLISSIESAARKGKVKVGEISDFTAETVEVEIKLPRNVYAADVLDALFAFTDCEQSISVNLLVIREEQPVIMTVTEVIAYHAQRLVRILTQELENERRHLKDRLHARLLERIFVEERIYKDIEEQVTQEGIVSAVISGFEPFRDEIKREVTEDDVDRLLKIPIRRISRYDINKAKKEMEEIRARLKEISHHLKNIVDYAISFLDQVALKRTESDIRKTEIISFTKTDAREAAQRNLDLRYDGGTGYLGHEIRSGSRLFDVSSYDRILVIRRTGVYSVIDVPEKLFVDKGMLACILAEKDRLSKTIVTALYRDEKTKHVYIKRCIIDQFILEKSYSLIPDGCKILKLTTKTDVNIILTYKPKPRLKVLEESLPVGDYLVKSVRAQGVRLTTKETKSVKFMKSNTSAPKAGAVSKAKAKPKPTQSSTKAVKPVKSRTDTSAGKNGKKSSTNGSRKKKT